MALKATDIPAASPHLDAAGGAVSSSAANRAAHTVDNPAQTLAANPAPSPQLNPEEQELARKRDEQAAIESELAERELRSANLRAELGAFERQYLHHVGSRYAELDELKAAVAERLAQNQPANERAQQAAREARARAAETQSTAGEKSEGTPRAFESSPEMKRLYREVAKRVHPDLTSDRADRAKRQQLMAEANEAYERGDETRLRKIFTEYEWSAEAVQGEGPGAELIRVIRRISQARGRVGGDRSGIAGAAAFGFVSVESASGRSAEPWPRRVERNGAKSGRPNRAGQAAAGKRARAGPLIMETRERSQRIADRATWRPANRAYCLARSGCAFCSFSGARPAGHGARFKLADQESFSWFHAASRDFGDRLGEFDCSPRPWRLAARRSV